MFSQFPPFYAKRSIRSRRSLKKIDRDRIDHLISKNDRFDRKTDDTVDS